MIKTLQWGNEAYAHKSGLLELCSQFVHESLEWVLCEIDDMVFLAWVSVVLVVFGSSVSLPTCSCDLCHIAWVCSVS